MMTYEEKLGKLVSLVALRTSEGAINWEFAGTDDKDNEIFRALHAGHVIQLSKFEYLDSDGDPVTDIVFSIIDDNTGRSIESVRDTALNSVPFDHRGYSGWYSLMQALYDSARRKTTGAEDAVNDLLKNLDDEIPF